MLITNPSFINGAIRHPYFCCLIFRYFFFMFRSLEDLSFSLSLFLSLSLSLSLSLATTPVRNKPDPDAFTPCIRFPPRLGRLQASSRSVPMFISRMQNSNLLHRYERSSRINNLGALEVISSFRVAPITLF